jgi:MFS family permease
MNGSGRNSLFRWLVLSTMCVGYLAMQINMIAYAPLLGEIAKDLRVDIGTATNLMTVFWFAGAIAVIVGGFLCDRYGIMLVVIVGLLCTSIPAVFMPWIGTSYRAVLWARVIQGISGGFLFCVISPVLAIWFPSKGKGMASGLMNGSVSLGAAAGVLAAPALFLSLGSWQQMAAWLSIPGWVALALAFVFVVSPKPQIASSQPHAGGRPVSESGAFKQALSAPITWIGVAVTFFTSWCFQSLYNLTPTYFAAEKPVGVGFGPMLSGKLMLAVMIAGMFGPVIAGMLQDRVFRGHARPVLLIGFGLTSIFTYAILSPVVHANRGLLLACLILVGLGSMFLYPAIVVFVSGAYPIQIVGKMIGLWLGIGGFGTPAGLFIGGLAVARFGSYGAAIAQIAVAAVVGFVIALFMGRPKHLEAMSAA